MPDRRPGPLRALSRSLARLRNRGFGEVSELVSGRLGEWWDSSETLILFVKEAGASAPLSFRGEGLVFRAAGSADADLYSRDIGTESPATFRARLAADVHCFVVEANGRLVHSTWVTTTSAWTREIDSYLSPPKGDAYVYESFTRSDARGRGIYPFALAGILAAMAAHSVGRVWVGIESRNEASRRAITKAGFVEGFSMGYRRRRGRLTLDTAQGPLSSEAASFLRKAHRTDAGGMQT